MERNFLFTPLTLTLTRLDLDLSIQIQANSLHFQAKRYILPQIKSKSGFRFDLLDLFHIL